MKKTILAAAIMLLASASFSQRWLPEAPVVSGNQALIYGKWIRVYDSEKRQYDRFYFRKNSPVGLKDIIGKTLVVLENADVEWDDTKLNDILLPSFVDGITDYQNLYLALESESGSIYKMWITQGYAISLNMKKDYSAIFIRKL